MTSKVMIKNIQRKQIETTLNLEGNPVRGFETHIQRAANLGSENCLEILKARNPQHLEYYHSYNTGQYEDNMRQVKEGLVPVPKDQGT